jgi:hypothetical protein
MSVPQMVPANELRKVTLRLERVETALRQLASASGTLDAATIYKGGLTVIDPATGARIRIGDAMLRFWDDYDLNPNGAGSFSTDTAEGNNIMRWGPPFTDGNPASNRVVFQGRRPGQPGNFWIYTDGQGVFDAGGNMFVKAGSSMTLKASGRMFLDGDGGIDLLTGGSLRVYELPTTGSAANVRLDGSTATIQWVTSSLRYKADPKPAVVEPREVLRMQGRTWLDKGTVERAEEAGEDISTIRRNVGFIAEELDKQPSLRQFVDYDDQGRPDAIQYDRLTVALLELAKAQQGQLDAMAARLDALEAKEEEQP